MSQAAHQERKAEYAAKLPWLVVDKMGLRKTLERKVKAWAIYELVQNAWDEDATEVAVTLTQPDSNGMSILTCTDNSPKGYADLSKAPMMFAESYKKADPTKRGRFNAGEKYVLSLCDEARITSTTGTILFHKDDTRTSTPTKTRVGSEFYGVLPLTQAEYDDIANKVQRIFPPITTFNGVEILPRKPIRICHFTLATEIADDNGVLQPRQRKTQVRLYEPLAGETPMLYEKGLPVVELDVKWHVDVQQKIPLNIERDNVRPSYRKAVNVAVVNEMAEHFEKEESSQPWVQEVLGDSRVKDDAVKTMLDTQYGEKRVLESLKDKGSNREAVSRGYTLVPRRALSKDARQKALESGAILEAHDVTPTDFLALKPEKTLDPRDYDADQKRFVQLIKDVSPLVVGHEAVVSIIADERKEFLGCTRWKKDAYEFEINLAYHDCSDWAENYKLLIHELAHHKLQSNDHLRDVFYRAVTTIGMKLIRLTLTRPELFQGAVPQQTAIDQPVVEEEAVAAMSEEGT